MRALLLAIPFALVACSGGEVPPADAPATAMTALTDADVSGTWQGTSMMEGTDSVFLHWTQVCNGGTCTGTSQESPDSARATYTLDADSVIGVAAAVAMPDMGGAMVVDHWIVRMNGDQATGTGMMTLADMPDSVVARYRFTGSRVP